MLSVGIRWLFLEFLETPFEFPASTQSACECIRTFAECLPFWIWPKTHKSVWKSYTYPHALDGQTENLAHAKDPLTCSKSSAPLLRACLIHKTVDAFAVCVFMFFHYVGSMWNYCAESKATPMEVYANATSKNTHSAQTRLNRECVNIKLSHTCVIHTDILHLTRNN